jgi:hypothetical protein
VIPDGGDIYPGSLFLLSAQGATVDWTISVSGGDGQVTFSVDGGPGATSESGALSPGLPLFVTVTVAGTYQGRAALVVTPGDVTFTVENWGFSIPGGVPSVAPQPQLPSPLPSLPLSLAPADARHSPT